MQTYYVDDIEVDSEKWDSQLKTELLTRVTNEAIDNGKIMPVERYLYMDSQAANNIVSDEMEDILLGSELALRDKDMYRIVVNNVVFRIEKETKYDIFSSIQCALTHDISVCERCGKCEGEDAAEIRLNLIKKLEEILC